MRTTKIKNTNRSSTEHQIWCAISALLRTYSIWAHSSLLKSTSTSERNFELLVRQIIPGLIPHRGLTSASKCKCITMPLINVKFQTQPTVKTTVWPAAHHSVSSVNCHICKLVTWGKQARTLDRMTTPHALWNCLTFTWLFMAVLPMLWLLTPCLYYCHCCQ